MKPQVSVDRILDPSDYICMEIAQKMSSTNNHYLPLQYHLGMTVYVSQLIKQPELFFYNKH